MHLASPQEVHDDTFSCDDIQLKWLTSPYALSALSWDAVSELQRRSIDRVACAHQVSKASLSLTNLHLRQSQMERSRKTECTGAGGQWKLEQRTCLQEWMLASRRMPAENWNERVHAASSAFNFNFKFKGQLAASRLQSDLPRPLPQWRPRLDAESRGKSAATCQCGTRRSRSPLL